MLVFGLLTFKSTSKRRSDGHGIETRHGIETWDGMKMWDDIETGVCN